MKLLTSIRKFFYLKASEVDNEEYSIPKINKDECPEKKHNDLWEFAVKVKNTFG